MKEILRLGQRFFLGLSLLMLVGCGYSATRLLPANYQVIYIAPFQNNIPITDEISESSPFQSNLPRLEEDVTQGVINRFLFDGNLRVTTHSEEADLLLEGKLYDFYRQALRQRDDDSVDEYRLNLVAEITLKDRKGELVWEIPNLTGDTTYFLVGSLATSEITAIDDMIEDFSRRVVERVIEYW